MSAYARVFSVCLCVAAFSQPLCAQTASNQGIKYKFGGTVRDPAGAPIAGAEIAMMSARSPISAVLSGEDGTFSLGEVSGGALNLRVRRLGFAVREMRLEVGGDVTSFDITLNPVAAELPDVVMSAEGGRLAEFYEHKAHRSTFGKFFDQAEIRRTGALFTSELFRSIPGISVRASTHTGNTIRIRNCRPTLWVDGQRMPDTELDEVASPSDVGGVAFFPSLAGVPPQYLDRMNKACGVIIVWTRAY